jgi:hypothetical protein
MSSKSRSFRSGIPAGCWGLEARKNVVKNREKFAIRKFTSLILMYLTLNFNSRFAIRKWGRDEAGSDPVAGLTTKRTRCSSTFTVLDLALFPTASSAKPFTGANCDEGPDNTL